MHKDERRVEENTGSKYAKLFTKTVVATVVG